MSRTVHVQLRTKILYGAIVAVFVIFGLRVFYLQVVRGGYYGRLALADQQKQYEIPAERGTIYARDGTSEVPLVLNEKRYRLVADPTIISDEQKTADALRAYATVPYDQVLGQLRDKSVRYSIIGKKLTRQQADDIRKLELAGIFLEDTVQRTYPQGDLAAQILGFVDDEGEGKYGIEQYLQDELKGKAGRVKAITDQRGVPLLASGDNIETEPQDGTDIVLTIDIGIQRQLEDLLKAGLERARSVSGSAVIMNPNNGEIVAMANYPTFSPADFSKVEDPSVFSNAAVASPLEPGSIMKTLTAAAVLDSGSASMDTSFYDPGVTRVDDATITNVEEVAGAGTRTVQSVLQLSLNTGAVQLLRFMGGGEINKQARETWHTYMTRFGLGSETGIEQGYEAAGIVPDPNEGFGLNVQYANTSFGQGLTATPLQMAAGLSSIINGGTYYKPHLTAVKKNGDEKKVEVGPQVVRSGVVSAETSRSLVSMMEYVVDNNNPSANLPGYLVGGKTGTAQIARPEGGYYADKYNGTYLGFIGSEKPSYVIVVRVNEPKIGGYAGSQAAGPIFSSIVTMLANNFTIP